MNAPAPTLTQPGLADVWRGLRAPAAGLCIGLAILAVLFHAEGLAAVRTWIDSTAYNHCFLVIPIAVWLIWDRRAELQGMRAIPVPWAFVAGVPLAIVWLAAERLGIMEGRQLVALTFVELMVFSVVGWRLWWQLAGPLLYLYFLVPFGEFLVPKLQDVTTVFVRYGLQLVQIPAFIDGYTIEIPEGTFYIAEACAGLRFLIASIAFGALYSLIMYRSPWRRFGFMVASIIVPVIANGFRALGIVALGHILGSAQAAATDHVLYGWIFFSLVILMLIGLGLPFREDDMTPRALRWTLQERNDNRSRLAVVAAVAVAVVAAISPVVAADLNRAVMAPTDAATRLDAGPGCVNLPVPRQVAVGTPGQLSTQQIACDLVVFDVKTEVFSPRTTAGPVMGERRRLSHALNAEDTEEDWLDGDTSGGQRVWRVIRGSDPESAMAVGLWIDGAPARLGLPMRLHMAWTSVTGTGSAPVLVSVTPAVDWTRLNREERQRAMNSLTAFLLSHHDLGAQVRVTGG